MPFVVESRVGADVGLHPVWVGGVTLGQAPVLDHGRCCWMRQRWQAVVLVDIVAGQMGTGDALNGSYRTVELDVSALLARQQVRNC
jgi:hypothetical protein